MTVYTIHFIRHGITEANLRGEYVGSTDLPLCNEGAARLAEYKEKYDYPQAPIIFSSPMKRCLQTVEILYGRTPAVIPDLRECDFGEYERKTAAELIDDPVFNDWLRGERVTAPPGGESGADFAKRVSSAFTKIIEAMMKTKTESAVICTHGGVIMTLMAMFALPRLEMKEWMVDNGCGFTVRTDLKSWMRANLFEVSARIPSGMEEQTQADEKEDENGK